MEENKTDILYDKVCSRLKEEGVNLSDSFFSLTLEDILCVMADMHWNTDENGKDVTYLEALDKDDILSLFNYYQTRFVIDWYEALEDNLGCLSRKDLDEIKKNYRNKTYEDSI